MKTFYVSSEKITGLVETTDSFIINKTPPILRKFIGQPLENLTRWMTRQGNFNGYEMENI